MPPKDALPAPFAGMVQTVEVVAHQCGHPAPTCTPLPGGGVQVVVGTRAATLRAADGGMVWQGQVQEDGGWWPDLGPYPVAQQRTTALAIVRWLYAAAQNGPTSATPPT